MATAVYMRDLRAFYEADSLSGADGTAVSSWTDLSGNNRHLTASTNKPVINTPAVNSKKSVQWDGTKNPLKYTGALTIRCGFIVLKPNGAFGGTYEGILTALTSYGILVGIGGGNQLFDFLYSYFEIRVNDRIFDKSSTILPNAWSIVYFKFWQNLSIDGIQVGADRDFSSRAYDGEIAALALWDRDFCENEVRTQTASFANSYQLPIADVFPYQGMKTDGGEVGKVVLSDNQVEPITRIKDEAKETFDLNFIQRTQNEFDSAKLFWRNHYPNLRLIYRDYQHIPPVDFNVRILNNFNKSANQTVNNFGYSFSVAESAIPQIPYIPAAPTIPDESAPADPPSSEAWTWGGDPLTFGGDYIEI